jgi:hypothetical protein
MIFDEVKIAAYLDAVDHERRDEARGAFERLRLGKPTEDICVWSTLNASAQNAKLRAAAAQLFDSLPVGNSITFVT